MEKETFNPETEESKTEKNNKPTRREFLKQAFFGALAAKELLSSKSADAEQKEQERTPEQIWEEIKESVEKLTSNFNLKPEEFAIVINPERQEMLLVKDNQIVKSYNISTAAKGISNKNNSNKTPFGTHRISAKIGDNAELGTVFEKQSKKGKTTIYTEHVQAPSDLMTTRLLALEGLEKGINDNSAQRGIFIHGTNEEGLIGEPASHGCIRMINKDVIELFDTVPKATLVEIQNKEFDKKEGR